MYDAINMSDLIDLSDISENVPATFGPWIAEDVEKQQLIECIESRIMLLVQEQYEKRIADMQTTQALQSQQLDVLRAELSATRHALGEAQQTITDLYQADKHTMIMMPTTGQRITTAKDTLPLHKHDTYVACRTLQPELFSMPYLEELHLYDTLIAASFLHTFRLPRVAKVQLVWMPTEQKVDLLARENECRKQGCGFNDERHKTFEYEVTNMAATGLFLFPALRHLTIILRGRSTDHTNTDCSRPRTERAQHIVSALCAYPCQLQQVTIIKWTYSNVQDEITVPVQNHCEANNIEYEEIVNIVG